MATDATNVTDASYANLPPREKGLFILLQIACVANVLDVRDPEKVWCGLVITGFAPVSIGEPNARPPAFDDDIAAPALRLLRVHLTRYSSDELQHCVMYGCTPYERMTVQDAQRWVDAGFQIRTGSSPFRSSVYDPHQFSCFTTSIITGTSRRVPCVVISGQDEKSLMRLVFLLGYHGLLTKDSWGFNYPSIPGNPDGSDMLDLSIL